MTPCSSLLITPRFHPRFTILLSHLSTLFSPFVFMLLSALFFLVFSSLLIILRFHPRFRTLLFSFSYNSLFALKSFNVVILASGTLLSHRAITLKFPLLLAFHSIFILASDLFFLVLSCPFSFLQLLRITLPNNSFVRSLALYFSPLLFVSLPFSFIFALVAASPFPSSQDSCILPNASYMVYSSSHTFVYVMGPYL
ncbi:unnamed protein product [Acanthosepion pharaonis]|uniref:Uncharacterized protein n=1 Tax=Acanthosepion pharaonis TaxID=158019 RepID=A0A812E0K1_ACAPH|nr:unnamed protein product [Sepia pharaonis]